MQGFCRKFQQSSNHSIPVRQIKNHTKRCGSRTRLHIHRSNWLPSVSLRDASESQGNLPRPKNMPPACFLNGFSIPVRQIKNHTKRCGFLFGDPYGNRTHVTAVKGRCLNRLTNGPGSGNLIRTDDIPGMNRVLYQLSYAAICGQISVLPKQLCHYTQYFSICQDKSLFFCK